MNPRRFAVYLAILLLVLIAAFLLAMWGLAACAPAPLPGDEAWAFRHRFLDALQLVTRGTSAGCFLEIAPAMAALSFARWALWLLGGLVLLMLGWETLGRAAWLGWLRSRGGHSVLAGAHDDLVHIARRQRKGGSPVLFLAADPASAAALARRRPFAEIGVLGSRSASAGLLARFGAGRARLVAATTRSDSANRDIAEAELEGDGMSEILVRLEHPSVRAMSSHRLRQMAEARGRKLAVLSLEQLQTRRGMAAAMSGRYTVAGSPRVHIAVSGSGPRLQTLAFDVARQGFGLENEVPLLSLLRTGANDFAPGELERLVAAESSELRVLAAPASAPGAIDRAIAEIAVGRPPLLAVHCVGEFDGDAEELARRWEAELVANHLPVPPIVAYGKESRPIGTTGMIRVVVAPDLAEAREVSALMDARARAVHQDYYDAQKAVRGAEFGKKEAEVTWERLAEAYRDDNRAVADQMDYQLARIFMVERPGATGVAPSAADVEMLAEVAHARWTAAKALNGWRFATPGDAKKLLHPDMIPYKDLDEAAKQKDRDVVKTLPAFAALAGEALFAERRVAVLGLSSVRALSTLIETLRAGADTEVPVAVVPLDDAAMAETAAALIASGIAVEAVLDTTMDAIRHGAGPKAPDFADVLRHAWRIHLVTEGTARDAVTGRAPEVASEEGTVDART